MRTLLHFLCIAAFVAAAVRADGETVTSLRQLVSLSPEVAAQNLAVKIDATLLIKDDFRSTFFIHDGTASCFVDIPAPLRKDLELKIGNRYAIGGTTAPGAFLPLLTATSLTTLAPGAIPEPKGVSGDNIFDPALDAQWIEFEGRVNATLVIEEGPAIEIATQGWKVYGLLPRRISPPAQAPWNLLERRVRIRAIAAGTFNDDRQMTQRFFYIPSLDFITPIGETEVLEKPVESKAAGLLRPSGSLSQPVVIRGTITHYIPGDSCYIMDSSGTVRARTPEPLFLSQGDFVEAEGFPSLEPFRPTLRTTRIRKLDPGQPPEPTSFDASAKRISSDHLKLITLDAKLLAIREIPEGFLFQAQSGSEVFDAILDKRLVSRPALSFLRGSTLRFTGICELQASRFFYMETGIDGFRIQLRSNEDIVLLSSPPWWNTRRVITLIGTLLTVALLAAAWAVTLRRRVAAQTGVISMKIARETLLEERQRIARDWHDTMEQQLMGVAMLVEDATAKISGNPEAIHRLHLAERMLGHCRNESRASIRDLRSVTLEAGGLTAALHEFLTPLSESAKIRLSIETVGNQRRLPGRIEHQLLRIAQEAVANVARHASASSVSVTLDFSETSVSLTVSDDGVGFSLSEIPADGTHLGLAGMQERAKRIGGSLAIRSSRGSGTIITITLPPAP